MSVSSVGSKSAVSVQMLVNMSTQLDDLRRQLGTGKRANSYAGIGIDRGLTVGLRNQLNAISSFDTSITTVSTRLKITQTTLTQFDTSARTVKTAAVSSPYVISQGGQTTDQRTALNQLDQLLALLNTRVGDQYIYSGKAADKPAVESLDHIMNGYDGRAGLKTVTAERNKADLGADNLGRLVIPAAATAPARIVSTAATLSPDAPAIVSATNDISALASAGGTLQINGTNIAIAAGATATDIVDAVNNAAVGVTASLNSGHQLVLTSANPTTAVDVGAGTSAGLLTEIGLSVGVTNPTNLVTQGAVSNGQTLTLTVGANPPLSITFGTGAGQVATFAALSTALGGLAGGTASLDPVHGNISVVALNTTDTITVGGTANAAAFGILSPVAAPSAGTRVALSEDVAGSPFGLKLSSVTSSLTGVSVSGPSGTPPRITADVTGTPAAGDAITFTFKLPDGSSETTTLTATTASPAGTGQFTIGATPAATAANLQAALTSSVTNLAKTSLAAASATVSADNFFMGDPPQRVAGASPYTATGFVGATAADTVFWYIGEDDGSPARTTATSRIDPSIVVSYGMRANEHALASSISGIAAFAAMTFSDTDTTGKARYQALSLRVATNLAGSPGQQTVADIEAEVAGAQSTMVTATDRHKQTSGTLQDLLQTIEVAPIEEVSAKILTLQTRLQASLQTTALLAKTSLVNFL
jgi:flagellar hook-associated protein 3 FlgL